jgi:hypothetical protein
VDKKQLVAITNAIVAAVQAANNVEEAEARTLVGIALRKNADAIVAAIVNPTLSLTPATAPAA